MEKNKRKGFTLAEGATQVDNSNNKRRFAFTLAEVLITLGIIGVVAALTVPTLIQNYQTKSWNTASSVFTRKFGEALRVMNTQHVLTGHSTTKEFVEELSKYMKIVKICDSNELNLCFPAEFSTEENDFKTTDLQDASKLNKDGGYGTETIGVQFADGVTALIAYNKKAKSNPFDSNFINLSSNGTGKDAQVGLDVKDVLSILYDVTANSNPNTYTNGTDIRGINVALGTKVCTATLSNGMCINDIGTNYSAVHCNDPSSDDYKYCGEFAFEMTYNYWAGANKVCAEQGMKLPTKDELLVIYAKMLEDGIPTTPHVFWSSSLGNDVERRPTSVSFENGTVYDSDDPGYNFDVICIAQ